jgi:uncharacterized membrane protein
LAERDLADLIRTAEKDTTPPLLELAIHFSIRIFGSSEFSVRLPSLLAGFGTVIYILLISVKLFKKIDLIPIILLSATNILLISFSQEARAYSFLIFFIISSFYHFTSLLEKVHLKNILLFILFSVAAFYSHQLAVVFILSEGLYIFIREILIKKKRIKTFIPWVFIFSLIGLLCIPWVIVIIRNPERDSWLEFNQLHSLILTLYDLSTGLPLFLMRYLTMWEKLASIFLIALLLFGSYIDSIRSFKKKELPLLTFFFWIPLFITYLISYVQPILYVRYVCFLVPIYILLIYKGIQNVPIHFIAKIIFLCLVVVFNLYAYSIYISDTCFKPHYKEMTTYIYVHTYENDAIVHIGPLTYFSTEYYMLKDVDTLILDPNYETPSYTGRIQIEAEYARNLTQLNKYDRLWTIEFEKDENKDLYWDEGFFKDFEFGHEKYYCGELILKLWKKKG